MKNSVASVFSVFAMGILVLAMTSPAQAGDDSKSLPAAATADSATTGAKPIAKAKPAPATKEVTVSSVATATATPAVAPPSAVALAPKATDPSPDTVTSGDLVVSHGRAVYSKDHIDVYVSIKNTSKFDERLGGAGSVWSSTDAVQVTKAKDGKETESPVSTTLPAGQSVDFDSDSTWLRIKSLQVEPKSNDILPVSLYFRRNPNADLKLALKGSGSSSIINWLKK
jgi:copper(I)-binding protein